MKISNLFSMLTYKEPFDDGFELLETADDLGQIDSDEKKGKAAPQEGTDKEDEKSSAGIHKVEKIPLSEFGKNRQDRQEQQNRQDRQNAQDGQEQQNRQGSQDGQGQDSNKPESRNKKVSDKIGDNVNLIKEVFKAPENVDVVIREFKIGRKLGACLVFIDGMADKTIINQFILRELMDKEKFEGVKDISTEFLLTEVLTINQIKTETDFGNVVNLILNGMTALFVDENKSCIVMETRGFDKRNVDKPVTENVIRGSQEGFTENIRTNLTLIHKIIKDENLQVEFIPLDVSNNINCAILYLRDVANPKIVKEVKRRLKGIKMASALGDGVIEQMIEDRPFSLLPQVLETERPDRAASFIMEGKVLIIAEGTPFVLSAPATFVSLIHSSEDSLLRWQYGTFLRIIRFFGMTLSILLPSLYIALTLYHQEMIPTLLLDSIAKSRENVPFPTIIEVLIMELSFELIREGGIRIPSITGQTLGIVGALILGQAAVSAGLVSPIMIIIVAITGLGSFTTPNYGLSVGFRILRFVFIFFGSIAGFYGIALAIIITGGFFVSIKSFGVPFFAPMAPTVRFSPDRLLRMPTWKQELRPDQLQTVNSRRQPRISRKWKLRRGEGK